MADWYCSSVKWTSITAWAASTAYSVGDIRRQVGTPAMANRRAFRCTTAGTSGGTEPAWVLTKGATTNDGTVVWTEVTGNSSYGWSAAHAKMSNSAAWMAAGDRLFVGDAHANTENNGNTIAFPGTSALPNIVLCVSEAGSVPPVSADLRTTAQEAPTGGSAITITGCHYSYGIKYIASNNFTAGAANAVAASGVFDNCVIGCGTGSHIYIGSLNISLYPNLQVFKTTNFQFGATTSRLSIGCPFVWEGGSIVGATLPTILFAYIHGASYTCGRGFILGVDLSTLGSGKSLVDVSTSQWPNIFIKDCKLGASVAMTSGISLGRGGPILDIVNADSADTNYRFYRFRYSGEIFHETTVVRTGGATDGTTPVSRKMTTSANAALLGPLESDWISYWNEITGSSVTITIEVITDNVTLKDSEAYIEVEYLGTAGFPLGNYANDRVADVLAAAVNQDSSTVAWTTTGLATPVKQKLSVTITPQEKGLFRARVCLAKASTTMYFDPLILASSGRQFMLGESGYMNEAVQAGGATTSLILQPSGIL